MLRRYGVVAAALLFIGLLVGVMVSFLILKGFGAFLTPKQVADEMKSGASSVTMFLSWLSWMTLIGVLSYAWMVALRSPFKLDGETTLAERLESMIQIAGPLTCGIAAWMVGEHVGASSAGAVGLGVFVAIASIAAVAVGAADDPSTSWVAMGMTIRRAGGAGAASFVLATLLCTGAALTVLMLPPIAGILLLASAGFIASFLFVGVYVVVHGDPEPPVERPEGEYALVTPTIASKMPSFMRDVEGGSEGIRTVTLLPDTPSEMFRVDVPSAGSMTITWSVAGDTPLPRVAVATAAGAWYELGDAMTSGVVSAEVHQGHVWVDVALAAVSGPVPVEVTWTITESARASA